jgi:hypothetical protein
MEIQELLHETAEAVVGPPAAQLTTVVSKRMRRRKALKAVGTGLLSVAVVGTLGAGYAALQPTAPRQLQAAGGGTGGLLPDRAVGAGRMITTSCGAAGCVPVLTTVHGRYMLPGPTVKDSRQLTGVGLSPDGRWVAYIKDGEAELRDLTSTTTYRVTGSRSLGTPVGWSTNGHWALVRPGWPTKYGTSYRAPIRVDLRTGHQIAVREPRLPSANMEMGEFVNSPMSLSLLPSGDLAIPTAGPAPSAPPPPWHGRSTQRESILGQGIYHIIDPVTGTEKRRVAIDDAVVWTVNGFSDRSGHTTSRWTAAITNPTVRSDGRYGIFQFQETGLMIADLSTGAVRKVDLAKLTKGTALARDTYFWVQSYTPSSLVLIGSGKLHLNGDATHVLAVTNLPRHYGALPGQLLP